MLVSLKHLAFWVVCKVGLDMFHQPVYILGINNVFITSGKPKMTLAVC